MAKLLYITNASLDGYIEDATGAFNWVNPEQVHAFITGLMRPVGTCLLGRRLHETMAFWDGPVEGYPPHFQEFARVWQQAAKVVYSRTLTSATTSNTRVEHDFDPEAVRTLKRESAHDIMIGGAELATHALEADLVDECHLFVNPVIVGRGKPAFGPALRRDLELLATRRFDVGVIHGHYRVRDSRREI